MLLVKVHTHVWYSAVKNYVLLDGTKWKNLHCTSYTEGRQVWTDKPRIIKSSLKMTDYQRKEERMTVEERKREKRGREGMTVEEKERERERGQEISVEERVRGRKRERD